MIVYLFHKIEDNEKGITVAKSKASRLFAHIVTATLALETGLDPDVYDLPLTVRIDGALGKLCAEDGRTVTRQNGARFIELHPGEKLRLILN